MSEKTVKAANKNTVKGARVITAKDVSANRPKEEKVSGHGFAQYIRALRQNWRQGTVKVKGRSDVTLSGKKPWRQKGTGRARAGTARSPLWRGGGVTHGPQPRVRTLKVSKKIKRGILRSLFWDYLERGSIVRIDASSIGDKPKTALAYKLLVGAGLKDKKVTLFVHADDVLNQASFANIANVRTLFFDQANAYDLASGDIWVVLDKDFNSFKEMVKVWL